MFVVQFPQAIAAEILSQIGMISISIMTSLPWPHSMSLWNCPTPLRFSVRQGEELASEEGVHISGVTRRLQGTSDLCSEKVVIQPPK